MTRLKRQSRCSSRLRSASGSVLIVTLWTLALLTILIAALASQTRLSARVAWYHQQDLQDWAAISAALNQAEMDVMLERMDRPVERFDDPEEMNRRGLYRYNGDEIELYYPQAEGLKVRIYDHAGKINLREISRVRLRDLLEKQLGEEADDQIDELVTAWGDWQDLNDQPGINGGAERDYYLSLDPPYDTRDGAFQTVDEILLIKGFAEVFADIDLDAAFTLYGEGELVNLNLATVEAMRLLPGLDDELIREIVRWRRENEFNGNGDVARIVPAENMAVLREWLSSRKTTNYYTVMVYRDDGREAVVSDDPAALDDPGETPLLPATAYAELIEWRGGSDTFIRPRVLKVNPYQPLPLQFEFPDVE